MKKDRKHSKTIAVMNNKGGCGKTTTALRWECICQNRKECFVWDNDPQSNLSQRLGLADDQHKDEE